MPLVVTIEGVVDRRRAREDGDIETGTGLDESIVREISSTKGEPDWLCDLRLAALAHFEKWPLPGGDDLAEIELEGLGEWIEPMDGRTGGWADAANRRTATVGSQSTAAAQRTDPAGATARHQSEEAFRRNRRSLERRGVVFSDLDTAVRQHPELVEPHLAKIIPSSHDKFAALNTSVWSGGSFIYVPPGVEIDAPLEAYSRINATNVHRFDRTLIVADEGSSIHYIDGCSSPVYSADSLHSAVVEIVVKSGARVTHTTIQNWSSNVFNLATKGATVEADGHMAWIEGTIGSRLAVTSTVTRLVGRKATVSVLSLAYAGRDQHQETGAEVFHAAAETSCRIVSKSISAGGGRCGHRRLVRVEDGMKGCRSHLRCDALLLDEDSVSETPPPLQVGADDAGINDAVTVSRVELDQLFYLMSRGLSQDQAVAILVNGFIEPVTRMLPIEYAVEWSRLIELQLGGSVG